MRSPLSQCRSPMIENIVLIALAIVIGIIWYAVKHYDNDW